MRVRVVWAIWVVAFVLVVGGTLASTLSSWGDLAEIPYAFGFILLGVGAATAGVVVTLRVRGNAVGPILLGLGLGLGMVLAAGAYGELGRSGQLGPLPGAAYFAWLGNWTGIPVMFGFTAFLLLLFPDGHLFSPRWRWVAAFTASGVALASVASAFAPGRTSGFENPFGATGTAGEVVLAVEDATNLLALPVLGLAALAVATRLRRARGVERLQLTWFTYVAAIAGLGLGLSVPSLGIVADLAFLCGLLGMASLPIVAGVAILRYGLYDIDVVIKRTLVYGPLTAALVGTYLLLVLVLQLLLRPLTGESGLAVAGSTLAVAALFRPARARIQTMVDRRFYRERYDAERTLQRFAASLRDEIDLDALGTDLRCVVRDTVQPAHVSLWMRQAP